MRLMLIATLLLAAAAANASTPTPDSGPGITMLPLGDKASPQYDCTTGNEYMGNVGGYASNHTGAESYAILFDPTACATCDLGVTPTWLYFVLQLEAAAVFQLSASIADVVDLGGGCYTPGAEQLVRPAAAIPSNGSAGGWIISMPWNTECMDPGRPYFLIFTFPAAGTGVIGPHYDNDGADPCRVWRNDGSGWVDPSLSGVNGDVFIWAETSCCSAPVATDESNWGSVKSMFR